MSIENRLSLINQQRLDLVSAVNDKGGELTSDDMFPEIITGVQSLDLGVPNETLEGMFNVLNGTTDGLDWIEKVNITFAAKEEIRQAILAKDVPIPPETELSDYPTYIESISSGSSTNCHRVTFIDWRGDDIASVTVPHGEDVTPPDYTGDGEFAIFHSWIGDSINVTEDRNIYAQYTVLEDKTRLIIELMPGYLSPTFRFTKLGYDYPYEIDWGDGLSDSGDGGYGGFAITHNYSTPGRKVITLTNLGLGGSNNGIYEIVISGSSENMTYPYRNILKEIILKASSPAISSDWFRYRCLYYQFGLECILLPYGMTSIGNQNSFSNMYNSGSLKHLTFPTTYTGTVYWDVASSWNSFKSLCIGNFVAIENGTLKLGTLSPYLTRVDIFNIGTKLPGDFGYRWGLSNIYIPDGIKSLGNQVFTATHTNDVYISNTLEIIGNSCFMDNKLLKKIDFPSSLLSIGSNLCVSCSNIQYFIFRSIVPPTILYNTFYVLTITAAIIYVPDSSVDAYKEAPNWSTYASRIYPLSEYVE